MKKADMQKIEIDLLLEAIFYRYGYDFRDYARASLERRIRRRVDLAGLGSVSEMIPLIMHDPDFFDLFLGDMSITVTSMFRDPYVFKKIRQLVCPKLKTYARINVWVVGCATGEEVYSMAILLKEEGLLKQTRIYATDFNNCSLDTAAQGIYPAAQIKLFTKNYLAAGGRASFADYYQAKYDSAKIKDSLKEHITFANHNLMKDRAFAETHLILCRNVLIYFNNNLQNRVLNLFRDSLVHRGYLVLGDKETLDFTSVQDAFEAQGRNERIYRKKNYV